MGSSHGGCPALRARTRARRRAPVSSCHVSLNLSLCSPHQTRADSSLSARRLRAATRPCSIRPSRPQRAPPSTRARRVAPAGRQTRRRGAPARRPRAGAPQRRLRRPGAQLLQPCERVRAGGRRAVALPVPAPAAVLRCAAGRSAGTPDGSAAAGGRCKDNRSDIGRASVEMLPCRYV